MESILTSMAIQILAPIAVSVASALIIWLLGEAGRWVRTKTQNEKVINAMDRLTCTAATTVAELEQALVPALKARTEDGKLTARERGQLQRLALEKIKTRLTPAIQQQAGLAIADLDSFLQAKIEQAVLQMKVTNAVLK